MDHTSSPLFKNHAKTNFVTDKSLFLSLFPNSKEIITKAPTATSSRPSWLKLTPAMKSTSTAADNENERTHIETYKRP